jgi:excisionase family DNA binding protein
MARNSRPIFNSDLPRPGEIRFVGRIRAAELLDVSPQTIDKFIRRGQLRAFHIGRKIVLRWDELLRMVEGGEIL